MFWNRGTQTDRHAERIRKTFARCASSFEGEARTAASMAREQMSKHGFRFEDLTEGQTASEREILEKNFRRAQRFWAGQDERDKARVLGALAADPVHIDALAHSLEMDVSRLSGLLLELELLGTVRQHPGKYFSLRVETETPGQDRRARTKTEGKQRQRREHTGDARQAAEKVWVAPFYTRRNGTRVKGHWRAVKGHGRPKTRQEFTGPREGFIWIESYTRGDGVRVAGHYRKQRKATQQKA